MSAERARQPPWYAFLLSRKLLICVLQGFSSGLPFYVLIQLVPGWLRREGIDLATISLFSLGTLPYTWKFMWSPLVDRFRVPLLGRRRGWAIASQSVILITIAQFGIVEPTSAVAVVALMFATSLFSATQDIVLDAYRREMLADEELGTGNSFFINAYRFSSLVPGSLAFVLADRLPWSVVFWVVPAFMLVGIVTMLVVPETTDDRTAPRTLRAAVVEPFFEFFTRGGFKAALLILAFLFLYKLGDNLAVALQTPFYLDVGFSLTQIGTVAKFTTLGASIAATALGGLIMLRFPINKALWVFGVIQVTTSLGFALLVRVGPNPFMLAAAASYEYLGTGLGTVALTAFIAQQTSRSFTATQLALLTSLTAVPRTLAGSITGFVVQGLAGCDRAECAHDALMQGWFEFFFLCAAIGVPGMLLLLKVAPWSGTAADAAASSQPAQISQS